MRNAAIVAASLALAAALPGATAEPAKAPRLALVIGNAAYRDNPLPNPANDAADVARALKASGFTVIERENATLRDMHLALREFGDRLGRQSSGLFYFAGHGMQVRGHNYLLPVDADVAREDEVAFSALDLNAVMEKLDSAKNPVNFVILDACRNNPFGTRLQASARGLAQVEAPPGTLIAFATAPGSTAADGSGRNGLYTQHLVRNLPRPGLAVEEVFKAVRAAVRSDSRGQQVPWESTSLESAFYFVAPPAKAAVLAAAPAPAAAPSAPRSAPSWAGAAPSFTVGDTWTYRIANLLDGSERQSTVRITDIRGEQVFYASGSIGDRVGNSLRTVYPGGRVDVFKPANFFYLFPMRSGASSTLKTVQLIGERTLDLDVTLKVGGEEEVETPAGRMKAIRIERVTLWKTRNGTAGGTRRWVYWYNAGVKRYVLAEDRNVTSDGKELLHERHELASYNVR
jgi:uncharacterized caspase-like protein